MGVRPACMGYVACAICSDLFCLLESSYCQQQQLQGGADAFERGALIFVAVETPTAIKDHALLRMYLTHFPDKDFLQ